jgi:hypothetical protein
MTQKNEYTTSLVIPAEVVDHIARAIAAELRSVFAMSTEKKETRKRGEQREESEPGKEEVTKAQGASIITLEQMQLAAKKAAANWGKDKVKSLIGFFSESSDGKLNGVPFNEYSALLEALAEGEAR